MAKEKSETNLSFRYTTTDLLIMAVLAAAGAVISAWVGWKLPPMGSISGNIQVMKRFIRYGSSHTSADRQIKPSINVYRVCFSGVPDIKYMKNAASATIPKVLMSG